MSRLQTPIRRNDTVVVTTGKDSGKRGRVLKVLPVRNRLIVEARPMSRRKRWVVTRVVEKAKEI